jgi:hypothetical protein
VRSDEERYQVLAYASGVRNTRPRDERLRQGFRRALADAPFPEVLSLEAMDGILVAAVVPPGLPNGWRNLTVTDAQGSFRATAPWLLDPGTYTGRLEFVRGVPEQADLWEAPAEGFILDTQRVEVRTDQVCTAQEILIAIQRGADLVPLGGRQVVPAKAVPGRANVYRTDPLLFVQPGREAAAAAPKGVHVVPCEPGQALTATVVDRLFQAVPADRISILMSPANLKYADGSTALWKDALRQVAGLWDLEVHDWDRLSDEKVETLTAWYLNHEIKPGIRGPAWHDVRITAADHAAMLFLRREFIATATEMLARLHEIAVNPPLLPAYREELRMALRGVSSPEENPVAGIRVTPPPGWKDPGNYYLLYAVSPMWTPGLFPEGTPEEERTKWIHGAIGSAITQQVLWLKEAIAQAQALDAKDVEGLLRLTGRGFGPILEKVRPRLLRLVERTVGGTRTLRWEPDGSARITLNQIAARLDELTAARLTSTKERDAALALLSVAALHPGSLFARVVLVAASAASVGAAAYDIYQLRIAQADLEFAKNAAAVLGWGRFHATKAEMGPDWVPYATLAISLVGFRYDFADLARIHRLEDARRVAALTVKEVRAGGAEAMSKLPPAKAETLLLAAEEARFAASSGKALDAVQSDLVDALEEALVQRAGRDTLGYLDEIPLSSGSGPRTSQIELKLPSSPIPDTPLPYSTVRDADQVRIRAGHPLPNTVWTPLGGGPTYFLGNLIGRGAYGTVYRLLDASGRPTGRVLKVVRAPGGFDPSTIEELRDRLQRAADALAAHSPALRPSQPIPQLRTHSIELVGDLVHVIQDEMPAAAKLASRNAQGHLVVTPEQARAIMVLYRRLANAKFVWFDGHPGNVYFYTDDFGEFTAGILDPDMLLREGERAGNIHYAQRIAFLENGSGQRTRIRSLETVDDDVAEALGPEGYMLPDVDVPMSWSAEVFMARLLEFRGFIRYGRVARSMVKSLNRRGDFVDGSMSVSMVREYFNLDANVTYGARELRRRIRRTRRRLARAA